MREHGIDREREGKRGNTAYERGRSIKYLRFCGRYFAGITVAEEEATELTEGKLLHWILNRAMLRKALMKFLHFSLKPIKTRTNSSRNYLCCAFVVATARSETNGI